MPARYTPSRRDLLKHGAAASVASVSLAGLPVSHSKVSAQLARNETLFIGGNQWGPPTNFNPVAPSATSNWPAQTYFAHLWEQLFTFNLISGENEPLLAKEIMWDGTTSATVTLNDGTAFSDGSPLTSEDVVYSWTLPERVEGLSFGSVTQYVDKVEAVDDRTIKFSVNQEHPNPGMVQVYMVTIPILPKTIWEPREAEADGITGVIDLKPVASGPYQIADANAQQVVLLRNDNYWGNETHGQPKPKNIVHPIAKSNDDANLALSRGEIDLSQTFTPQIWKMWEDQEIPVGTWYKEEPYHVPGNIPLLIPNISKPGLDNPKVRLALAYAINYEQIAFTAMSRYSEPMKASLIVPKGAEEAFFDEEVATSAWSYNPDESKRILEEDLKATRGDDGIYSLEDGTRLGPWKVVCPYGWTDWMTAVELVVQGGKEAGFDLATEFPEAPIVASDRQAGSFDITMMTYTGVSAADPWQRFRDVMDNRGVPEAGQPAYYNFNRYKNADAEALLDQIPTAADEAAQKDLYQKLDDIYRAELPVIALMYRPLRFYEFNEMHWKGFPTSENPYAPPMDYGSGIHILSKIEPTGM